MVGAWLPVQEPGELVIAQVHGLRSYRGTDGKARPVVLVRRENGYWQCMLLTTNATYRDGTPRIPVPDCRAVGLSGPGYLWGNRLRRVSVLDLRLHVGWVDPLLAAAVIVQARLKPEDAAAVVRAVDPGSRVA